MPRLFCKCGVSVNVMKRDYMRLTNGGTKIVKLSGCGACRNKKKGFSAEGIKKETGATEDKISSEDIKVTK